MQALVNPRWQSTTTRLQPRETPLCPATADTVSEMPPTPSVRQNRFCHAYRQWHFSVQRFPGSGPRLVALEERGRLRAARGFAETQGLRC